MDDLPPAEHPPPDVPGVTGPAAGDPSLPAPAGSGTAGPDALAEEAAEIRRLIDAGAGSPEELRALADRLRAHREREDQRWRSEVKPTLKRSRRGGAVPDPPPAALGASPGDALTAAERGQRIALGVGLAVVVLLVVLLAASSSILWILVPVVALLVYAWWHGRRVA